MGELSRNRLNLLTRIVNCLLWRATEKNDAERGNELQFLSRSLQGRIGDDASERTGEESGEEQKIGK